MSGRASPHLPGDRVGDWALSLGVAGLVSAFVPVVGDFVAAPAAVLAIILGLIGVRRYETRQAARVAPAVGGAVLGAAAIMVAVIVLIATHASTGVGAAS